MKTVLPIARSRMYRHLKRRLQPILAAPLALMLLCWPGDTKADEIPVELILVESLPQASDLLQRLQKGEDFAALAHKYSIDPTAGDGGYLGRVDPESLRLELRDALRGVGPGQLTAIAKLPNGYAILRRLRSADNVDAAGDDRARLLALSAQASARPTVEASGYSELMLTVRNRITPAWGRDLKEVCATRTQSPLDGIAALQEQLTKPATARNLAQTESIHHTLGGLFSSTGKLDNAIDEWEGAYRIAKSASMAKQVQSLEETLGTGYLHRATGGSEIFPMRPAASPQKTNDAENAIDHLNKSLAYDASNEEVRWLLNLAYMMAGKYPDGVPKDVLIAPSVFASKEDLGRFPDVAPAAGVDVVGTAGGAIVDDFDNDGLLDIVTSQVDDCAPLHFFHNNGDGTFTNRADAAGLSNQTGGLNITHADYNNDGCPDILVLRGGWEFPRRRSLLRNNCDGTFTDVTAESGLLEPIRSSQSAVWTDIDNDGNLDLFIGNENAAAQLFLNLGDGKFLDISKEAGVDRIAFSKAVVSADYDNDGFPDLYVSNYNGPGFLYHNNGDRTFTEVSSRAGVQASPFAFGAWFFDYDNDGWPDLFVTSYYASVEESVRSYMGLPRKGDTLKLYRNKRDGTFQDVTAEVGLDRVFMPMGCNFGDIDNDGFLDIYMGMGNPSFASVLPNTLFHNQAGKHFADITTSSGTGAISKGHGVAFADFGNSGDEDIFTVMGGPSIGDRNTARLFENPGGHGNDWITLRLVGGKSNRSAIGARIAVTVANAGQRRTIYRTVGSGGSFGESPLQQHIGLGKAASIERIEIFWPASKTKQDFANVDANQFLEIKESAGSLTKLTRLAFRMGGVK
jgi:hypothetical protein